MIYKMRLFTTLLGIVLFTSSAFSAAEPAKAEIEYLLKYVESSKGKFIRGGKEYSPKEAADHLRQKLSRAGGRVKTAEDFVAGIASKSYLSGSPYKIKLPDGSVQPSGPWLTEALAARRREAAKQPDGR